MGRAPCCDKATVKKGPWSPEEDDKLKQYVEKYGIGGNWIALPQKAGLTRCGKSCRLRWLNYLRPNIKHGEFSDDEERIICSLYASIGSRWSIIAAQLPGRTDNDIKNYWNTKLKKKLMSMGFNTNTKTTNKGSSSTTTSTTYNLQYPMAMLFHPHHHPSSTSLSSSLSSSSAYQCTPTIYYNPPSALSFTGFETTNTQNYHHHHQVKDNNTLLMFGGDELNQAAVAAASCSSSDGSCLSSINNEDQQGINHITIVQQNCDAGFYGNNQEEKPFGRVGNNGGLRGQTQSDPLLDYGLEEIKQLISTNINVGISSFNYFDESKAEE